MPAETVDQKAQRLFDTGAATYLHTIADDVHVWTVTGDNDTYEVTIAAAEDDAVCTCPAQTICAHINAARIAMDAAEPEAEIIDVDPEPDDDTAAAAPLATTPTTTALSTVEHDRAMFQQLSVICDTEFVPKAYRGKPAMALAAVKSGQEMGIDPMYALAHIHVINGSTQPDSELKLRKYRDAGHRLEVVEHTDTICTLTGTRGDTGDTLTVSYSVEDAKRAKLDGKDNWRQHPRDMLWARAVGRLVRRLAPDCMTARPPSFAALGPATQEDPAT